MRGPPNGYMLLLGAGGEGTWTGPSWSCVVVAAALREYLGNTRKTTVSSQMGSRKITRRCPGYGSAQNFAGYFAGLVKPFFEDFNYQKSTKTKTKKRSGPARPGPGLGPAWAQLGSQNLSQKHENGSDLNLMPPF